MNELEDVWASMLRQGAEKAEIHGRSDVAEYLRLRLTNDAIRSAGVKWLFDVAMEAAFRVPAITVEREEPHTFARGSSNMVGARLDIKLGVRCMSVEAGWARRPGDGIMTGGALAAAAIKHFGMPRETVEMRLIHADGLPLWFNDENAAVSMADIERHIRILCE